MASAVAVQMVDRSARAGRRAWSAAEVIGHERPADDIAVITVLPEEPIAYLPGQALPVPSTTCSAPTSGWS